MNAPRQASGLTLPRRRLLGLAGAGLSLPVLGACTGQDTPTPSTSNEIAFWDRLYGPSSYSSAADRLMRTYTPKSGPKVVRTQLDPVKYMQIFGDAVQAGTGPALASIGNMLSFRFAAAGDLLPADPIVERLRTSGAYDDLLPGTIDTFKQADGSYSAVPWAINQRVLWYDREVLADVGLSEPKDWDDLLAVVERVGRKSPGVIPWNLAAADGSAWPLELIVSLMINNGGGLFDTDGGVSAATDRNVEAVNTVLELARLKAFGPDPTAVSWDQQRSTWNAGKAAVGLEEAALTTATPDRATKLKVMDPPAGPHGDLGGLNYVQPLMMFKQNNPDPAATADFAAWYVDACSAYWDQGVTTQAPVLSSTVHNQQWAKDPDNLLASDGWFSVSKGFWAQSAVGPSQVQTVFSSNELRTFATSVIQGSVKAPEALNKLQSDLETLLKK